MKTVAAVFDSLANAEHVAHHLGNLGITSGDIHVIAGNDPAKRDEYLSEAKREETTTASAATDGARFGGGIGILAGAVALAIPGVGPIIAGGVMATVLTGFGIGAVAGGLIGGFKNLGISHEEAHLYEEAIRRGAVFIAVNVDDPLEPEVSRIMTEHGARDIRHEAETWRATGWQHPYPNDSSVKWHEEPENTETAGTGTHTYPWTRPNA